MAETLTSQTVALIGGHGFIGSALMQRLLQAGARVKVISRRASPTRPLPEGATWHTVSSSNVDSLQRALSGADAVVNLVGVLQSERAQPWGPAFDEAHVQLPKRLAQAMQTAGVQRLVHISALGVGDGAPSMYLRSKTAGEAVLRQASHLQLTVLRPSVVFGAGDSFVNLFARLAKYSPFIPLATAQAQFQPVSVSDLCTAILHSLEHASTIGSTYDCVGPEVFSLGEIVKLAAQASGHPRWVCPLPDSVARAQAWLFEQLPGTPLLSRDNLDSASIPNTSSAGHMALLGVAHPESLRDNIGHILQSA
ncbi:MAG: hypothetical protein RLZZ397_1040 [Pseudomonadota bacterium]